MKVTTTIDVTPKQYFNHLCSVIISDIKKKTDKEVTMKELIEGYTYERELKMGKKSTTVRMEVGPLIQDKFFIVKYETNETKCSYYYDFKTVDEENIITYCEETGYKQETVGNYFGNLKKKLTEKSLKMKIMNNIELTETYIKNHLDD